jgi:YgiT-type zinc finger domain-containing protein
MNCEFCPGQTVRRKVTRLHWLNERLYIVENVPAQICLECGGRYFHAQTLDEIDSMLQADHPVAQRIEVEVVTLENIT